MIWQLGRGIVSNAAVRLPDPDDDTKRIGPYIQHTAQVDPGNSGGPLLIQTPGVPTGFAVAGINTVKALGRQAANYSIPMDRVRSFLDASLGPPAGDELTRLNARLASFIEGLAATKAVYAHIADYLSNACVGENMEYAFGELFNKAPRTVQDDIMRAFRNPVDGMTYAVAWLIENNLRTKSGTISVTTDPPVPAGDGRYKITFRVNDKDIDSEWVNEYGIWRIRTFGDFASGDKTMIEKRKKEAADAAKLRAEPNLQISFGYANVFDRGSGVAFDLISRSGYVGFGFDFYIAEHFFQIDAITGFYFPLKAGSVAFTPFIDLNMGMQIREVVTDEPPFDISLAFKPGLQFTTAAVPGLHFQFAYQFNLLLFRLLSSNNDRDPGAAPAPAPGSPFRDMMILSFSIGYSFD
jgi:serine protease Do